MTTVTDGDGRYTFDHVPAGEYNIAVVPPDGYRAVAPRTGVSVGSDDLTGQDFALTRPGSIGGKVTDVTDPANPVPVHDAGITIDAAGSPITTHTDADGFYFVDDLDPARYDITVTVPDGDAAVSDTHRAATITAAGEDLGDENFTVTKTFPVSGSVTTHDGEPVPGATITISDPTGTVVDREHTGDGGGFTTPSLVPGDGYQAELTPPPHFDVDGSNTKTFTITDRPVTGLDFTVTAKGAGSSSPPPPTSSPPSSSPPTSTTPPPSSGSSSGAPSTGTSSSTGGAGNGGGSAPAPPAGVPAGRAEVSAYLTALATRSAATAARSGVLLALAATGALLALVSGRRLRRTRRH